MQNGIIILEGGDASGKTTLAEEFKKHGAHYLHSGLVENGDYFTYHLEIMNEAIHRSRHGLVVVDRHWISELIYGPIMRGHSSYHLAARCFDRIWRKYGAVYVLCIRKDIPRHIEHFEHLSKTRDEYPNKDKLQQIVIRYYDLQHGNVAHPDSNYIDQYIRRGDFDSRPDVLFYDMDKYTNNIDEFVMFALATLGERRGRQPAWVINDNNLVGYLPETRFMIVGEQLAHRAPGPWPFFWSDRPSAATWLNNVLHYLDVFEPELAFINALNENGMLGPRPPMLTGRQVRYIPLGQVARRYLQVHCLADQATTVELNHPQWERRFNFGGVIDYAQKLREALRA